MSRPPIEKLKEHYEVSGRVYDAMGGGSSHKDIIEICDYALSLEAKNADLERRLKEAEGSVAAISALAKLGKIDLVIKEAEYRLTAPKEES